MPSGITNQMFPTPGTIYIMDMDGTLNYMNLTDKKTKIMKEFIFKMFSASDDVSMKRVVGLIVFLVLLNLSYFVALKWVDIEVWKVIESWLRALLYSANLLLGLGAVLDGAKIIKGSDPAPGEPSRSVPRMENPPPPPPKTGIPDMDNIPPPPNS